MEDRFLNFAKKDKSLDVGQLIGYWYPVARKQRLSEVIGWKKYATVIRNPIFNLEGDSL